MNKKGFIIFLLFCCNVDVCMAWEFGVARYAKAGYSKIGNAGRGLVKLKERGNNWLKERRKRKDKLAEHYQELKRNHYNDANITRLSELREEVKALGGDVLPYDGRISRNRSWRKGATAREEAANFDFENPNMTKGRLLVESLTDGAHSFNCTLFEAYRKQQRRIGKLEKKMLYFDFYNLNILKGIELAKEFDRLKWSSEDSLAFRIRLLKAAEDNVAKLKKIVNSNNGIEVSEANNICPVDIGKLLADVAKPGTNISSVEALGFKRESLAAAKDNVAKLTELMETFNFNDDPILTATFGKELVDAADKLGINTKKLRKELSPSKGKLSKLNRRIAKFNFDDLNVERGRELVDEAGGILANAGSFEDKLFSVAAERLSTLENLKDYNFTGINITKIIEVADETDRLKKTFKFKIKNSQFIKWLIDGYVNQIIAIKDLIVNPEPRVYIIASVKPSPTKAKSNRANSDVDTDCNKYTIKVGDKFDARGRRIIDPIINDSSTPANVEPKHTDPFVDEFPSEKALNSPQDEKISENKDSSANVEPEHTDPFVGERNRDFSNATEVLIDNKAVTIARGLKATMIANQFLVLGRVLDQVSFNYNEANENNLGIIAEAIDNLRQFVLNEDRINIDDSLEDSPQVYAKMIGLINGKIELSNEEKVKNDFYGLVFGADTRVIQFNNGFYLRPGLWGSVFHSKSSLVANITIKGNGLQFGAKLDLGKDLFFGSLIGYLGSNWDKVIEQKTADYKSHNMFGGFALRGGYHLFTRNSVAFDPLITFIYSSNGGQKYTNVDSCLVELRGGNGFSFIPGLRIVFTLYNYQIVNLIQLPVSFTNKIKGVNKGFTFEDQVRAKRAYFDYTLGIQALLSKNLGVNFASSLRLGAQKGVMFDLGFNFKN